MIASYFESVPRFFQVVTVVTYHDPVFHLLVTAVVEIAPLMCLLTLARGRLPRGDLRDSLLFVVLLALFWNATPVPGQMLFYRPYTANYVFGATAQLLFLVTYRLSLNSSTAQNVDFRLSSLLFLAFGFICGMANEHTGIAMAFGIAILVHLAWRRGLLKNWMIAGGIGFGAGYAALLMAPGQSKRYAGLGMESSILQQILDRAIVNRRMGVLVGGPVGSPAASAPGLRFRLRAAKLVYPCRLPHSAVTAAQQPGFMAMAERSLKPRSALPRDCSA